MTEKEISSLVKEYCAGKDVVDFGCGNGKWSFAIFESGAKKVIGIDKNPPSIVFLKANCEESGLLSDSADIVFDKNTIHYLDKERAFKEMARILRGGGKAILIETLGHNPLLNLYRKKKNRTAYGVEKIFKVEDLKLAENYFRIIKKRFFWFSFLGKYAYKIMVVLERI